MITRSSPVQMYSSSYWSFTIPASSTNRTRLARPPAPASATSADFTEVAHSGYAGKSAITAMICAGGASIVMDWVDWSAMRVRLPPLCFASSRDAPLEIVLDGPEDSLGSPAVAERDVLHAAPERAVPVRQGKT